MWPFIAIDNKYTFKFNIFLWMALYQAGNLIFPIFTDGSDRKTQWK